MSSSLAMVIAEAQALLNTAGDGEHVDLMTDEQLLARAGPGYPEFEAFELHGVLPTTAAGLDLLGEKILRDYGSSAASDAAIKPLEALP